MEFFVFRLNRIKILNNRDWGKGEVKLLSFVTGADGTLPVLEGLKHATTEDARKDVIVAATQEVLSSKVLFQVENVVDGHRLSFGDTGYALYTAQKIPTAFNWSLLAFELDDDVRAFGRGLDGVLDDPGFDAFAGDVLRLVGSAGSPAAVAGAAIAKFIFRVVSGSMLRNKDDQIGLLYQSFNRFEHYVHGERKRDGVPDLTQNLRIDYSIFGTTY